MADVAPTKLKASLCGVSINVTGTAITGTLTGDWVTPCTDGDVTAIAVHYDQDEGTATTVTVTIQVKLPGDTNAYSLCGIVAAGAPSAVSFVVPDANTDVTIPLAVFGAANVVIPARIGGIEAIRATAAIGAGDGAAADNLRISFYGTHRPWTA